MDNFSFSYKAFQKHQWPTQPIFYKIVIFSFLLALLFRLIFLFALSQIFRFSRYGPYQE